MATSTLPRLLFMSPEPSNAELLDTMASLLAAVPGPTIDRPLSRLLQFVCSVYCAHEAEARAEQLAGVLAEYLNTWHVLRTTQLDPTSLDQWAAVTPIVFVRTAMAGCARHHRIGGGAR